MTGIIMKYNVTAPSSFPFELVNNILSYEGEHELVKGEIIRRVRKIPSCDNRFNTIVRIPQCYGYHMKNSERNEYVIGITLPIGEEIDGDLYYHLEKIIDNLEYGENTTILNVDVSWDYRRSYDVIIMEHHKIFNNDVVRCIKPSTRNEYEYYGQDDDVENVEE